MARLFGFLVPPWFEQVRHVPREDRQLRIVEERREFRQAYENAVSRFADASGILYRRAAEGVRPTNEELEAYLDAHSRLEVTRATYQESLWH